MGRPEFPRLSWKVLSKVISVTLQEVGCLASGELSWTAFS